MYMTICDWDNLKNLLLCNGRFVTCWFCVKLINKAIEISLTSVHGVTWWQPSDCTHFSHFPFQTFDPHIILCWYSHAWLCDPWPDSAVTLWCTQCMILHMQFKAGGRLLDQPMYEHVWLPCEELSRVGVQQQRLPSFTRHFTLCRVGMTTWGLYFTCAVWQYSFRICRIGACLICSTRVLSRMQHIFDDVLCVHSERFQLRWPIASTCNAHEVGAVQKLAVHKWEYHDVPRRVAQNMHYWSAALIQKPNIDYIIACTY